MVTDDRAFHRSAARKPVAGPTAWLAIAAIFLINGLTFSAWVARIPTIAGRLALSPGEIGLALMALPAGAIVAFPLAGRLVDTRGSATTVSLFTLLLLLTLPIVGLAPSLPLLIATLVVLGFGNGGMDVSMNAQGIEVEHQSGQSIINSLHGCYSLGGFVGAAAGATAAQITIPPSFHFLGVSTIGLVVLWRIRRWLVPDADEAQPGEPGPAFALPPRSLWLLGALALCASVGEGAMSDWSGLYLRDALATSDGFAALGFAAFSVAMLAGRFSGDHLVRRFGATRLVRLGGLLAGLALGIAVIIDRPDVMLLGFAAVGLGLSVVYPLVFSAAGHHPDLPRGRAVASVATLGYGGFLAGPPILGWLAQLTSLRAIMAAIVLLSLLVAALAGAARAARISR